MKPFQISCICLIILLVSQIALSVNSEAKDFENAKGFFNAKILKNSKINYHSMPTENGKLVVVKRPTDGGIKEIIPVKFQAKYLRWKGELLTTEFGRRQWEEYAANKNFVLTVTVSGKEKHGAGTGKYEWDETGMLVGATINLGDKIDKGYPDPIYFPVMNSLALETYPLISGEILAAAKFAHEFGHVNQTAKTNADLFQRQNKLMAVYNLILLKNGYNTNDQKLIDLVGQMGGTPVGIWEAREYGGETNAMNFLFERIDNEILYCSVFKRLKNNIDLYAKDFEGIFTLGASNHSISVACQK